MTFVWWASSPLLVGGYLERRVYEKDGEEHTICEIVAEELDLLRTAAGRGDFATS